jgi:hypothetical protein
LDPSVGNDPESRLEAFAAKAKAGSVVDADDAESAEDANEELSTPSEANEIAAADRKSGSVSFEYRVALAESKMLVAALTDESVDVDGLDTELEELGEDELH